ncbi:MAG: hypothetical protein Tp138OMZ00d2C19078221_50 [Prokaryotic dsDNA virus sp.]|jgi:hypothetical protein|nr:MAG: hypothetical protein Tp138OMZ00d2C19078221_50 [Prokaryotic dsDNA virus sp.]|tara:strand:- start:21793 stop:21951 length:159 start_codon:yes stop_codon:yes gene_type:complete
MSRTIKGSKGAGYEYWSRRPNSCSIPGRFNKRLTHRIERQQGKVMSDDYEGF